MQEKTNMVADNSAKLDLTIKGKRKASNNTPIIVQGAAQEDVDSFTYLGSILDYPGGTDADVRTSTGKERAAFHQLKKHQGIQRNCYHHQG
ncbi:hypothetical protein DPMN_000442 [Dreissena polymorpha]|uniref:Uncharacterized protein n=1 Tax=Dreissena polymorpha TaxID=45954 RepID=A0A9D4MI51_DREPO|nr:hypothetical protein DPMN_000442 [Dreissena polymorpha]